MERSAAESVERRAETKGNVDQQRTRWTQRRISVSQMLARIRQHIVAVDTRGGSAWSLIDCAHASVMSCQHSRPMGRFAGHNVVADLLDKPMLPLRIDWYTTILDLGEWGAVYTVGWDREVVSRGTPAKETKTIINCQRIYPPRTRNREDILAAAAPVVTSPPKRFPDGGTPEARHALASDGAGA